MAERHGYRAGKPTPTYNSWRAMRARCHDPNDRSYALNGARGITVCARWRRSFKAFLADMGERPAGKTLDRIDGKGSYGPGNCRWATSAQQFDNRDVDWRAHLDGIRPLAAEWHSTDAGREWHREHARKLDFGHAPERSETCEQCGATYTTRKSSTTHFCSNKCKTRARYLSGVDNESRICPACGGTFTVNKYSPIRCCSRTCAQRLRSGPR